MRCLAVIVLFSACLALIACSVGSAPPQPGTPAFSWNEAKTAFHVGDTQKAFDNLDNLLRKDNEYTAKAQPWALVVSTGISHGMLELTDAYKAGVKANPDHPVSMYRQVNDCLRIANSAALPGADVFRKFIATNKDPQITLAFEYPPSNPAEPAGLRVVTKGGVLNSTEADTLQHTMMQRGVVYAVGYVVGQPDDSTKAEALFKTAPVQVPRERFLFGMAQMLYDEAQLYDKKHIDDPRRVNLFCDEATDALKGLPEDKPVKELLFKIRHLQAITPPLTT